jgi:hypothetical protein
VTRSPEPWLWKRGAPWEGEVGSWVGEAMAWNRNRPIGLILERRWWWWTFTVLSVSCVVSLLLNTHSPAVHKFSYINKKTFLIECRASHALLPSLHHNLQISDLSKRAFRVRTDENQKMQDLDCMVDAWELLNQFLMGFLGMGNRMRAGIVIRQKNSLWQSSSLFVFQIAGFTSFCSMSQYVPLSR